MKLATDSTLLCDFLHLWLSGSLAQIRDYWSSSGVRTSNYSIIYTARRRYTTKPWFLDLCFMFDQFCWRDSQIASLLRLSLPAAVVFRIWPTKMRLCRMLLPHRYITSIFIYFLFYFGHSNSHLAARLLLIRGSRRALKGQRWLR